MLRGSIPRSHTGVPQPHVSGWWGPCVLAGSSWAAGEVHQLCSCCILHCLRGKCASDGAGVWQLCLPVGLAEELSLCPLPTLTVSLWDLQDLLKKYCLGTPVSPVPLKVVLALEQLR